MPVDGKAINRADLGDARPWRGGARQPPVGRVACCGTAVCLPKARVATSKYPTGRRCASTPPRSAGGEGLPRAAASGHGNSVDCLSYRFEPNERVTRRRAGQVQRQKCSTQPEDHVLPRLRCSRPHQIRMPIELPIERDISPSARVVMQHRNGRRHTETIGVERAWRGWRGTRLWRCCRRLVERTRRWRPRWRSSGRRPGRQKRPLNRTKGPVLAASPVVWRQPLRQQIRVERIRPQRVLPLRQRHVLLVAVADFDCGSTLSGLAHAGIVPGAAHADRRVLGSLQ